MREAYAVLRRAMSEGICNCGTCPVHPPQCMCHVYSVPDCRPICRVPGHTGLNRLQNLIDYKNSHWQTEKKDAAY